MPNPYRGLAHSKGFGCGESGTALIGIIKSLPIDPVSQLRAVPSINTTYPDTEVQSFGFQSLTFLCAGFLPEQDVGTSTSCTIELTGKTKTGALVAAYCSYEALAVEVPNPVTGFMTATCNLPATFSHVTDVDFTIVQPAVLSATFSASFLNFTHVLHSFC